MWVGVAFVVGEATLVVADDEDGFVMKMTMMLMMVGCSEREMVGA